MALNWRNKVNNVDIVDANDVNSLAQAIQDNEVNISSTNTSLGQHKSKEVLDHPDGSVTTPKLSNKSVTTDKIADKAVTGEKIADGAITSDNLDTGSVDSNAILNGAVTQRHMSTESIGTDQIIDKSVTTDKIADKAITGDKIVDGEISKAKLTTELSTEIREKANKSDLTADNITSVYSSKLKPHKLVNKPSFPNMTGSNFYIDIASVTDIGGAYVPSFDIDYVWKAQHQNITSTTYFVNYATGSSSATGLNSGNALKYPSDAMKKAKSGDMIVIMGGYYPRNQLGFDQNKSVHIRGGVFCNADNNRSLTWTLVEGSMYKTTRSQAYAVWQAINGGSEFSELTLTPTLELCKSTNSSYFIDGDTVYVNTPDGYSGAPGYDILVTLNAVGATINTNVWCEGTVFIFGGQAACLNRSSTDPALFSDCTFKYAKQNGFMSYGGKSYLLNCESYNNGRDGFSYKKLNSAISYGFEVSCTAHHNGDDESTGSDNGSTAHEGSIVTRINGQYYENKGPNIADVNPGTMSYNLNCACSNSTATAQDRQIDYNIEDGIMYLDRCTSDGSFISLYEASVTMPQSTKSYNLGSVLPGVYRVKNVNGVAENLSGGEDIANKVVSISSSSTDVEYPSAKAVNNAMKKQTSDMAQNFAGALKGTVSGENAVRIDDSSPIEHEMKVTVSSKNLLPHPSHTTPAGSANGVTWTYTDDGSVILNGTCTKEINVQLARDMNVEPGTYTLYDNNGNGTTTSFYIQAFYNNTSTQAVLDKGQTFNLPMGKKIDRITLYVKLGTVLDNVVIKPQLERGTIATEYTPYVDPTSVTLYRYGKNLIDMSPATTAQTANGVTMVYFPDTNVTKVTGTVNTVTSFPAAIQEPTIPMVKGVTQCFSEHELTSANTDIWYYNVRARDTKNSLAIRGQKNMKAVTTFAETSYATKVDVWGENGITINGSAKLQLELSSTPTEYEPYVPAQTYSVTTDGTVLGVKNIYPTTSLLSDKDGVVIDVEYNRDINKAFEELKNAILSQGGNV